MSSLSLVDFHRQKAVLENKPFKEKKILIRDLGNYYQATLCSSIEDVLVMESERFINELFIDAQSEGISIDIQEKLVEATGVASFLSHAIQHKKTDAVFFTTFKRLGMILLDISNRIS